MDNETPEVLADPGLPLQLTLTIDIEGKSRTRYLGDRAWAVEALRTVALAIEQES